MGLHFPMATRRSGRAWSIRLGDWLAEGDLEAPGALVR